MTAFLRVLRPILLLTLLAGPLAGEGQAPAPPVRRIGYLQPGTGGLPGGFFEIVRDRLRDLGYVEGRNAVIVYRAGDGQARLAELAAELVRLDVEVIVAAGGAASAAARSATTTVPVVFSHSGDPIAAGLVESLGRPGGNLTGITWLAFELVGKRLELLKEAAPGVSRLAVLANPSHPGEQRELGETERTARAIGATVQYHRVRAPADFEAVFGAIAGQQAHAVVVFPDGVTMAHRRQIAEFALSHRLPSVFGWREYVEAGGLMAYGPNRPATARQLAAYVDRILRGARPAQLPVEQPATFELVINLKTAAALGLTLPRSLLARADDIIQ